MSNFEDSSPQDSTSLQNKPRELEISSVRHTLDLSTSEVKSDDSITSEAPSKDPEFEMLNPVDFDDGEPSPLTKSGTSSLGSFTEVDSLAQSPGVEMTMEHSDMRKLLHEAGRESGESSNETEERSPPPEVDTVKENEEQVEVSKENVGFVKTVLDSKDALSDDEKCEDGILSKPERNVGDEVSRIGSETNKESSLSKDSLKQKNVLSQNDDETELESTDLDASDGKAQDKVEPDTLSDFSKVSEDKDATLFSSITYLGSSTVNAPVSDTELKRTMAILKQQSRVAMDIVLSVSGSFDGFVKLLDPQTRTLIATYRLQKILFCGRGDDDGEEADCFAFNICHGNSDIFHCHVFRCLEKGAAAKILIRFAQSFRNRQKLRSDSALVYKFDLVFDILEDDGKGSYVSVPRDKTCFKLRRDVHKLINIQLHQLSNRLLILERCFGLLICPGRNVTHSDMNLLEKVTMENMDNGRTYIVTGNWDPEREDTLVLNTETKKDFIVYMTVAVDFVVTGVSEPVRFIKELGVKVYPSNERFWNPSRPKIKEQYTLELKLAKDEKEDEKSYEVLSLQCSKQQEIKEILTSRTEKAEDDDDDDDDEPLMSGSGEVARECSEEQLDIWSVVMTKWKDVSTRPKQVKTLIRKQGVPEPLRSKIWQMLVGLEDSNYLVESYKDLIRRESPNEQVIQWDIHRTFPGHEYFRSSEGEGQENLQKICRAYSVYDDEVGYCQGMSYLAAVLLLHLPEEQAFGVFVKIMYDYSHRELFLNGFEKLNERFFVLERITEEFLPDLHSHFLENNVEPHMFCSQWFLTLFTAKFPLSLVYRIMDLYLSEGSSCIYQIATALLKVAKKDMLQLGFEGILKYFRVSLPRRFISEEEQNNFMNVILSYKAVVKKLKRYEELYELKKEREKENEDPVERLQRENKQLMLANIRLEQENDSLAHELVTTKVSLRSKLDEVEEHAEGYLRDLEILQKRVPELEDENEKFRAEGMHVKDLLRSNARENEAMRQRYESIIEEYKKICSQFDERSEELKSNLENELREIKRRIGSCTNCSLLFTGDDEALPGNTFKASVKIEDSDQRLKELELELAQTKLSLVEAECHAQELEHRLANFMSAVAAEESKPWFRRSKLGTPAKK